MSVCAKAPQHIRECGCGAAMQVRAGKAALWMEGGKRMTVTAGEKGKEQMAMELTSLMLHKHYCENDVEALIALLDDADEGEAAKIRVGLRRVLDAMSNAIGGDM